MYLLDVRFEVDTRHWLTALLTQHDVTPTMDLVDNIVALRNISLATFTINTGIK